MILKNGRIVNEQFQYEFADIRMEGGTIVEIGRELQGGESVDCGGRTIIPGLFDIHTHECIGYQLAECSQESLLRMAGFYGCNGVTSYLATIDSQREDTLEAMCAEIGRYRSQRHEGAAIRGVHIEGMFFSEKRKGGHPSELLIPPSVELVRRLNSLCGGAVKIACVSPELEGADEFIEELSRKMVVSIAHTDADYAVTKRAVRLGARSFTHLFNGMRPLNHREPGVVGAAFDSPDTYKEVIADGMHLAPAIVRSAYRLIGPDRMILISDSCVATGLADGIYEIGKDHGRRIEVKDGLARLEHTDTICGSTFCLYQMFRNAVMNIGIDFMGALKACTINPARLVGLDGEIGSIALGKAGDLVVIDSDMDICDVYIEGKRVERGGK